MFRKHSNSSDEPTQTKSSDFPANRKIPPTIISIDVRILGNVVSDGMVDIDGRVEGNVKSETAYIRENGMIVGDVMAEEAHIFGSVHGVIKAKRVCIYPSAHIEGAIMHKSLSIEDGAYVDAQFKPFDAQPRLTGDTLEKKTDVELQESDGEYDLLRDLKLIG